MTRRIATPPKTSCPRRLLAGVVLFLGLAGCASRMPQTSAPIPENLSYPSFGAPAQIGTRPVMNPEQQQKKQAELESLGINRANEMQGQIDQGGDLQPGQ